METEDIYIGPDTSLSTVSPSRSKVGDKNGSINWSYWIHHPVVYILIMFVLIFYVSEDENGTLQKFTGSKPGEKSLHKVGETKYFGSRRLTFLAKPLGLDIDVINFITCQFLALGLSFCMSKIQFKRHGDDVVKMDVEWKIQIRLWFTLSTGLFICYFCFGYEILHVILLSSLSYGVIRFFARNISFDEPDPEIDDDPGQTIVDNLKIEKSDEGLRRRHVDEQKSEKLEIPLTQAEKDSIDSINLMPWIVFLVAMVYLSILHLKRLQEINYSLDITGPMMVLTQKVTSLAFSVRDGYVARKNGKSDEVQSKLLKTCSVSKIPSILEYSSFIFQFQSMLAGPLVFYGDFIQFIRLKPTNHHRNVKWPTPPWTMILDKIFKSIFYAIVFLKLAPLFPMYRLKDSEFLNGNGFVFIMFYLYCVTTIERAKYYHAWILAEAVCNTSGLGYDWDGKNWELITNVYPIGYELGLNFKETIESWNIGTMKWLRHVIYDRVYNKSKGTGVKTILTYSTSAIWHGYFPGYYLTFFSGALFTEAARTVRRHIRPFFVDSQKTGFSSFKKLSYDLMTLFVTRLVIATVTFSFMVLDFMPSIAVYIRMYFFLHISAIFAIIFIPMVFPVSKPRGSVDRRQVQKSTSSSDGKNVQDQPSIVQLMKTNIDGKNSEVDVDVISQNRSTKPVDFEEKSTIRSREKMEIISRNEIETIKTI